MMSLVYYVTPLPTPDTPTPPLLTFLRGVRFLLSPHMSGQQLQSHLNGESRRSAFFLSLSSCLPSPHPSIPSRSRGHSAVSCEALFLSGVCRLRCNLPPPPLPATRRCRAQVTHFWPLVCSSCVHSCCHLWRTGKPTGRPAADLLLVTSASVSWDVRVFISRLTD